MGPSSIALPTSLLKSSRKGPISARSMHSDEETGATNALTKTGSFMTYEQFSKQFLDDSGGEDGTIKLLV